MSKVGHPARKTIVADTHGPGLYDITDAVARFVGGQNGALCHLFLRHTSASLLIQENADPTARADLETFFARLIPPADHPSQSWMTHRFEGPDDMPAHLRAALLPASLSVPVEDGRLMLGTWQGIYLFEHRDTPHRRSILATVM